jgi:PEP-CTERM motif
MFSFSRNLAAAAACGLALTAYAADAAAAPITYTDFSAFQSATSGLTVDNFDAAPWRPVGNKPQGLSNLGVTWTAANNLFGSEISHSGQGAVSSSDGPVPGGDLFDWLEAALPANITAVGAWVTSHNQAHLTALLAYDALDNLLGSVSIGHTGHAFTFFGLITDTAIARVRFASTNVTNPIGDDLTVDDFSFGRGTAAIPVPEPSALALFGAALTGLALHRRKGRNKGVASGALDRHTLADIGIGPGEVLAAGREIGFDRLKRAPHT